MRCVVLESKREEISRLAYFQKAATIEPEPTDPEQGMTLMMV
jgi:hypothetical protein